VAIAEAGVKIESSEAATVKLVKKLADAV